jgi:hypothetical protein
MAPSSASLALSDGSGFQPQNLANQWGHERSHCGRYSGAVLEDRQPPSPSLDNSADLDSQSDEISSSSRSSSTYLSLGDESSNQKRKRSDLRSVPDAPAAKRHKGDDNAESYKALNPHDQHQNQENPQEQEGTVLNLFSFHAASFVFSLIFSHFLNLVLECIQAAPRCAPTRSQRPGNDLVYHFKEECNFKKLRYQFLQEGWTAADFCKLAASGSVHTRIFHVSVNKQSHEITLGKEVFPCGEAPGRRIHDRCVANLTADPQVEECSGLVICRCRLTAAKPDYQQQWNGCRVYGFYRPGDTEPFAASAVVFIRARKCTAQMSDMDSYSPTKPSFLNATLLTGQVQN